MSRLCDITGAVPVKGTRILRIFQPNLKTKRIFVPELKRHVTVKLTARALKTLTKNGAYPTLKKAGLI
jgi:large subunit ribosomal protein L28